MFRGLKKAFSKGRTCEVESLEANPAASEDASPVRPRSKSAAATLATIESTRSDFGASILALDGALPGGGSGAWNNNALSDCATPLRQRCGATGLSASPATATPCYQSLSPSAPTAGGLSKPAATGTAWGPSPTAEKEAPRSPVEKDASGGSAGKETPSRPLPRIGGLFRSGSTSARNTTVHGPTSVEPMDQSLGNGSDSWQSDDGVDSLVSAGTKNVQHAQAQQPRAELLDDAGSPSPAMRSGAMRAGSLMATPLAVESRRGPSVIG